MTARRVVLVLPRTGSPDDNRALERTLDALAKVDWLPVAVVDVADRFKALQMVADGLADVVVPDRPEHFPEIVFTADLGAGGPATRRTRPLPRDERPRLVERTAVADPRPAPDHPWRTRKRPTDRDPQRTQIIRRTG